MPNIGFTICHLAFSFPWVLQTQGSSYFNPPSPGQCSSECWSTCQLPVATRGNSGLAYPYLGQSECALRKRYVQLLSGFVGTFGRCCWFSFTLSKCLVTGIPRLLGSFREKVYPSLTVRAYNGLSWDTPAGYYLSKAVPAVMWQMGIC